MDLRGRGAIARYQAGHATQHACRLETIISLLIWDETAGACITVTIIRRRMIRMMHDHRILQIRIGPFCHCKLSGVGTRLSSSVEDSNEESGWRDDSRTTCLLVGD